MIEIGLILLLWLYLLFQLLVLAGYFSGRPKANKLQEFPPIAILIPARNEAEHIETCLQAVMDLNYPLNKIEVWVGNDRSKDQTADIVLEFSQAHAQIHLFEIETEIGSARAKGNVLAQLVKQSKAEYIFVTDADIVVGKNWILNLLPFLLQKNTGIVSGTTLVDGKSNFEKWQGLEWSLGNGYMIGLDQLGLKSTAVGNNMCFTRQAYLSTGGYENLPFSVTEDFQLFSEIRSKGFQSVNLIDPHSLNISKAQNSLGKLLHQRKRWMIGAQDLPKYWMLIFGLQAAFYPALVTLFFFHFTLAMQLWAYKFLLQSFFLFLIHIRLRRKIHYPSFLTYEFYSLVMHVLMMVFYLIPVKMKWKGREY